MFDIDGTLVESYDLDSRCFIDAVKDITGLPISSDWSTYQHVTDSGILNEVLSSKGYSNPENVKTKIKQRFLKNLEASLISQPAIQVTGANEFLQLLQSMDNVTVSLATGGWQESAIMKLASAQISFSSIPLASSNDHYSRTEIMKRVANKDYPCTYFGDGVWDKDACDILGYNFVLVGNKFSHTPCIKNFQSIAVALQCIGL